MNLVQLQLRIKQRVLVKMSALVFISIYKTRVHDVFSENPLNTDTQIIRTPWHVPLVGGGAGGRGTGRKGG